MRMRTLLLLLATSCSAGLANGQSAVAVVHSVEGKAWVKQSKDAKPSLLKKGDQLFAGQWASCAGNCRRLIISQCRLDVPVASKPTWQQVVAINCYSNPRDRAGRAKGEGVTILSPKDSERLRPEGLSLKWKPFAAHTKLKLSLKIYLGEKIWGPEIIDGSQGFYQSRSLERALVKAQREDHLVLVLTLNDKNSPIQGVKFYVISSDGQKNLERQLRNLTNETNSILSIVGRGALLDSYELYSEATEEFERALAIAKKQRLGASTLRELTTLAIQVNYMAYNDHRVAELCKSWQTSASPSPQPCRKIQ